MIKNVIVESTYTDIVSVPEGTGYANLGIYFCNTTNEDDIIDIFVNGTGNSPSDKTTTFVLSLGELPVPLTDI